MKSPYKGKFKVTQQYKGSDHDGLDLVGLDSKEIYSTISGTVEYAGWENPSDKTQGFGLYARIKESSSDDRYYFGHLSKINVKVGQDIAENQIIGIEGDTGNSTGSHCHYCARGNASKSQIKDISEISGIPNALGTYESTPEVYYLVKKSWKAETAYRTKYISQARIYAREHHYVIYDETGKTITSYRESSEQTTQTDEKISVIYQVWEDVGNEWLPEVTNLTDYAGLYGKDVCAVYARLSSGNIFYKVHYKGGEWLPEVKNREDYAGLYNKPIDALMMRTDTGSTIKYAVHLRRDNRWLPFVSGYDTSDAENGYAGIIGQEIDGIKIYIE